jgi:ABC-2 type transport system ATP-binding protein
MDRRFVVSHLTKTIHGRLVLNDIAFEVDAGRAIGLVGRIGAGKTTLISIIAGLRHASSGTFGWDNGPLELGTFALVDQSSALPRRLTLHRLGELAACYHAGFDRDLYLQILAELDLDPSTKIGKLSDGERKVTSISLALARRPELLLLDEPLASLDPVSRRSIMGQVLALSANLGTTVLISSHLVNDIERDCDWLIALDSGNLLLNQEIDSLLEHHLWVDNLAINTHEMQVVLDSGGRQLVRIESPSNQIHGEVPGLEEIVVAYLGLGTQSRTAIAEVH